MVWCVLTNGLVYQVYKSNEPVSMERKLLFEVDIRDAADEANRPQVIDSLGALSREAVEAGRLDGWGETVFIDMRTRAALAKLGSKPPASFVTTVGKAIDGPHIEPLRLKTSLSRVLGSLARAPVGAVVGAPPEQPAAKAWRTRRRAAAAKAAQVAAGTKTSPPSKTTHDIAYHTAEKPSLIVDLFERVNAYAMSLGPDVTCRPVKYYVGYFAGKKSFSTAALQKAKIHICLQLDPQDVQPWHESELRDVTNIGHFGLGNVEFTLRSAEQLSRLEVLMKQSYVRNRH